MINRPYLNAPSWVDVYENSVTITMPLHLNQLEGQSKTRRGEVRSFSRASRTRMIRMFSRLQTSRLSDPVFVTLTYHHGHEIEDHSAQADLNVFLTALRRDSPSVEYVWRIEFQRRGAPHYHLMLFQPIALGSLNTERFQQFLSETWHRIADPTSIEHATRGVHVREADSYRKAFYYMAKYVGKEEDQDATAYRGRRWATSRGLPAKPIISIDIEEGSAASIKRVLRGLVKSRGASGQRYAKHLGKPRTASVMVGASDTLRIMDWLCEAGGLQGHVRDANAPPTNPALRDLADSISERIDRDRDSAWMHGASPYRVCAQDGECSG